MNDSSGKVTVYLIPNDETYPLERRVIVAA